MSRNILTLLGFLNFENICTPCPLLKFPKMFQNENENLDQVSIHKDSLARIEEESDLYTNYRHLIGNRPKGEVSITYQIDNELLTSKVEFELELFQFNEQIAYDYDLQFERINFVMREQWLTEVIKRALLYLPDSPRKHLTRLRSIFEVAKRYAMENTSGNWGGLITLKRNGKTAIISRLCVAAQHFFLLAFIRAQNLVLICHRNDKCIIKISIYGMKCVAYKQH